MRKIIALGAVLWLAAEAAAEDIVAIVGGEPVTAAALEERAAPRLSQVRQREYQAKSESLDELTGEILLRKEAAALQTTAAELEKREINDAAAPPSDEEVRALYEGNKQSFSGKSEQEALAVIRDYLKEGKERERRSAYMRELRKKYGVRVLLKPPRVKVSTDDDPAKGPAGAPVTIVIFSDFQCPYCSRVNAVLGQVEEKYAGRVRVVFRDFPLEMHKDAPKAAEAAACAAEQGKFWEMHDALFQDQKNLSIESLKRRAKDLRLKTRVFDACLDSGKYAAEWRKDAEEGRSYGVTGTPAFFINGRFLSGNQPYEAFAAVIDDELGSEKN